MQIESNHAVAVFQRLLKSRTSDFQFNRLFTLIRLWFTSYKIFLPIPFSDLCKNLTALSYFYLDILYYIIIIIIIIFFLSFHLVRKITHLRNRAQINMLYILSRCFSYPSFAFSPNIFFRSWRQRHVFCGERRKYSSRKWMWISYSSYKFCCNNCWFIFLFLCLVLSNNYKYFLSLCTMNHNREKWSSSERVTQTVCSP